LLPKIARRAQFAPKRRITHSKTSCRAAKKSATDLETNRIRDVLRSTGWRVRGSGGAADRLGLKPTTLESRMARLGIARPSGRFRSITFRTGTEDGDE